ncbi:MAG: peptide chain release factor N(5)-glutamine methyltransferase [Mucinivorans sp.]
MTLEQTYLHFGKILSDNFSEREAKSLLYRLLEDKYGIHRLRIFTDQSFLIDSVTLQSLNQDIQALIHNCPIQHIVGYQEFCNRKFIVNPDVLIPRDETQQLIQLICAEADSKATILDIGTGSGAIGITLALDIDGSKVIAWDISPRALITARQNAIQLSAKVEFELMDVFKAECPSNMFDIIVSNPPYVTQSQAKQMSPNVLDYEPYTALFVSDENPLIFYMRIAELSKVSLKTGGSLYFEINEIFGKEMVSLLQKLDFRDIRLLNDINHKERFICAKK